MDRRLRLAVVSAVLGVVGLAVSATVLAGSAASESEPGGARAVQAALGTAFTYQGRLIKDGEAISDTCSMAFRLYDASTGTGQVGSAVTTPVGVNEGLFTVNLDFGSSAFAGEARWLGVLVSCSGDSGHADLGRQALTAALYALYAMGAGTLDGLEGSAFWQLGGNSGTVSTTHFVGTTDGEPLVFRTDGDERMRIDASGSVAIPGEDDPLRRGYTSTNLDLPLSVYVSGRYAYVASRENHYLAIFDVSDPGNIVARDYTNTNLSGPTSVYVSGHYAYVASLGNDSLAIFDVSDPDNVVANGYTSTNLDSPMSVYVSGAYAYVASFLNDSLALFELNNLEAAAAETGDLRTGYLDVWDNAIVGNNLHVQGGLNVGPGGALIGGDVGVEGDLSVVGDYVQFPTITGAPSSGDCNEASEAGRVVVRTDGATNLYMCIGAGGWVGK